MSRIVLSPFLQSRVTRALSRSGTMTPAYRFASPLPDWDQVAPVISGSVERKIVPKPRELIHSLVQDADNGHAMRVLFPVDYVVAPASAIAINAARVGQSGPRTVRTAITSNCPKSSSMHVAA
ncbi:hypothetical protein [Sphingomonas sp.]|uniref:hypothetical protein n=1 Tax=Sphingomonas sp. TaxID=28214 RepID=UPI0035BBCA05